MIHCYDHPKWREYGERLLRTVVGRYRDHESLLIWGVWDGASFPTTDGPVCPCYCASTLDRYAAWLKRRYTLDQLNERLHRRYRCWEDVTPPRSSRNVVEMLLYRQFHVENLAETLRWQVQVIRELDDCHELRAHGANIPRLFDQACAREVDSWGMSMPSNELLTGPDPLKIADRCFSFDWSRGIGRGGRWWNEEIYAGMSPAGVTWKPQSHPAEVTSLLWLSLIHGAAGAMFWQYTPEYLSFEAPGYSLTAPDRAPTGRLRAVRGRSRTSTASPATCRCRCRPPGLGAPKWRCSTTARARRSSSTTASSSPTWTACSVSTARCGRTASRPT